MTSRAVLRQIEPGTEATCPVCKDEVKFAASTRNRQVICNVFEPRMFPVTSSDLNRYWNTVVVGATAECWPWLGNQGINGDGLYLLGGKTFFAHRMAYFFSNGAFSEEVHHACENTICQNPSHLYNGSGIAPGPVQLSMTPMKIGECVNGHKLTSDNIYTYPDTTGRSLTGCRKCRAIALLRYKPPVVNLETVIWDRCEQFHEPCYKDAGQPYGEPDRQTVRRDRQGFTKKTVTPKRDHPAFDFIAAYK